MEEERKMEKKQIKESTERINKKKSDNKAFRL